MIPACEEKSPLNVWVSTNWLPGWASSARMKSASRPAMAKNENVVTRYWTPITLWSVLILK